MFFRIFRALKLDATLFEEVESREDLNLETWGIIIGLGLLPALAMLILLIFESSFSFWYILLFTIAIPFIIILSFLINIGVTWFIGSKAFSGMASFNELRRALTYSYVPLILIIIPCVNVLVFIWSLVIAFVAIRQTMDISNGKAIGVLIIANVLAYIPIACLGSVIMSGLDIFSSIFL